MTSCAHVYANGTVCGGAPGPLHDGHDHGYTLWLCRPNEHMPWLECVWTKCNHRDSVIPHLRVIASVAGQQWSAG